MYVNPKQLSYSEQIAAKRQKKKGRSDADLLSLREEEETPIRPIYSCITLVCNPKPTCDLYHGRDSVERSFLNGMVFPICHGGINLSYNL